MSEWLDEYRIDRAEGAASWAKTLDDGLLWVRPFHGRHQQDHPRAWTGLDRSIADLHARYERACMED